MIIQRIFFAGALTASVLFSTGTDLIAASTQTTSYSTSLIIPDHNANGAADTELISFPDAISINSLQVTLMISGGWNGDYYAYLKHGASGFAVLLNRAGVTGSNPYGYGDGGFNITLSDAAANGDVHFYQNVLNPNGSSLTGIWQPDGRNMDPDLVSGSSSRDAMLNSFTGMDPNGSWTLFVADNSAGGIGTLTGWGLSITAETVPEPGAASLLGIGFSLAALRCRQNRR